MQSPHKPLNTSSVITSIPFTILYLQPLQGKASIAVYFHPPWHRSSVTTRLPQFTIPMSPQALSWPTYKGGWTTGWTGGWVPLVGIIPVVRCANLYAMEAPCICSKFCKVWTGWFFLRHSFVYHYRHHYTLCRLTRDHFDFPPCSQKMGLLMKSKQYARFFIINLPEWRAFTIMKEYWVIEVDLE